MTVVFSDLFAYGQRSIAWVQIHAVDGGASVVLAGAKLNLKDSSAS